MTRLGVARVEAAPTGRWGTVREQSLARRAAIVGTSAVLIWILLFLVLPTDLPFFNDENAYVGGAAALKAGHGYRFEPYINLPGIGMYPPGYSAWLALFWKDGEPVAVNASRLEVANWIAAGCALLALAFALVFTELPAWAAGAVVIALGTSVVFTQAMTALHADVLFMAGSCLLALLVAVYQPERKVSAWWLAAGAVTGALYLVKTAALAYIVGLVAFGVLKGDFRRVSRLICFALPTLPPIALWFLLTRGIPTYGTYFSVRVSELGGWMGYALNVVKQAGFYLSGRWLVEALLSVPDRLSAARALHGVSSIAEACAFVLGLAFAVPIFLGIRRGLRHPGDQIALFVLAACVLQFCLWPYYLGARSAIVLIPFVANWLMRGLASRSARACVVAMVVVNIPANAWLSYKIIRAEVHEAPQSLADLRRAAAWVNDVGGTRALVAAGRDVPLAHFSEYLGRRVLANPEPVSDGHYRDVSPSAQDGLWADYLVVESSLSEPGFKDRYEIRSVFGKWAIAAPLATPKHLQINQKVK